MVVWSVADHDPGLRPVVGGRALSGTKFESFELELL